MQSLMPAIMMIFQDTNGIVIVTDMREYIKLTGKIKIIRMHRQIMGDPKSHIDHENNNKLDNKRSNLRCVTHAQNHQNRRGSQLDSKVKYRGVTFNKQTGKYVASVTIKSTRYHLEYYNTAEQAAKIASEFRSQHMPFSSSDLPKEAA